MDLPVADIAALGYYKVSEASRQNGYLFFSLVLVETKCFGVTSG